jgi:hypothetical protein
MTCRNNQESSGEREENEGDADPPIVQLVQAGGGWCRDDPRESEEAEYLGECPRYVGGDLPNS